VTSLRIAANTALLLSVLAIGAPSLLADVSDLGAAAQGIVSQMQSQGNSAQVQQYNARYQAAREFARERSAESQAAYQHYLDVFNDARAAWDRGDIAELEADGNEMLRLHPEQPFGYEYLGRAALLRTNFGDAENYFMRAREHGEPRAEWHDNLLEIDCRWGFFLLHGGENGIAETVLRKTLAFDSKNSWAMNALACAIERQDRLAEALPWYKAAAAADPTTVLYQENVKGLQMRLDNLAYTEASMTRLRLATAGEKQPATTGSLPLAGPAGANTPSTGTPQQAAQNGSQKISDLHMPPPPDPFAPPENKDRDLQFFLRQGSPASRDPVAADRRKTELELLFFGQADSPPQWVVDDVRKYAEGKMTESDWTTLEKAIWTPNFSALGQNAAEQPPPVNVGPPIHSGIEVPKGPLN